MHIMSNKKSMLLFVSRLLTPHAAVLLVSSDRQIQLEAWGDHMRGMKQMQESRARTMAEPVYPYRPPAQPLEIEDSDTERFARTITCTDCNAPQGVCCYQIRFYQRVPRLFPRRYHARRYKDAMRKAQQIKRYSTERIETAPGE
jgi:hypothetical protein